MSFSSFSAHQQACRSRSPGYRITPPDFGRSVNPTSTREADYAHQITICSPPPIFRPSYDPDQYFAMNILIRVDS